MAGPGGHGVRRRGGGNVAMCRQLATWEDVQEKVIGILVESKKEGKRRKYSYWLLYRRYFLDNLLIEKWEMPIASCCFWRIRMLSVLENPLDFLRPRVHL